MSNEIEREHEALTRYPAYIIRKLTSEGSLRLQDNYLEFYIYGISDPETFLVPLKEIEKIKISPPQIIKMQIKGKEKIKIKLAGTQTNNFEFLDRFKKLLAEVNSRIVTYKNL